MSKKMTVFISSMVVLGLCSVIITPREAHAQNSYGQIVIGHSQKCVDVPNGSMDDNIQVNQYRCDNSPEQAFALVDAGGGYYSIVAKHSGKCLDVPNGSMDDNIPVNQYQCDRSPEQSFNLAPVGSGYYTIVAKHSGKCINVWNGSNDDNIGLTQEQCNGQQSQMFSFAAGPTQTRNQNQNQQQAQTLPQQLAGLLAQQLAQQLAQPTGQPTGQPPAQPVFQPPAQPPALPVSQPPAQPVAPGGLLVPKPLIPRALTLGQPMVINADRTGITALVFSPDSSYIVSGGWENKVKYWNSNTGAEMSSIDLKGKGDLILDIDMSPDGTKIATANRNYETQYNTVNVFNIATGQPSYQLNRMPQNVCMDVEFSREGNYLAAGCFNSTSGDITTQLWNSQSGVAMQTFQGAGAPVAFSFNAKIITAFENNTLSSWDSSTGKLLGQIKNFSFKSTAISNDSRFIAGGGYNGNVAVWNINSGTQIFTIKAHAGAVNSVALSADGNTLISGGIDKIVRLWDVKTGIERAAFASDGPVESVIFSHMTDRIAVGSSGNNGGKIYLIPVH